ncbi:hypothetical protein MKW98_015378 [Papaver atlanticum]|uniref:HXXXD-type acyl-transferase family protein n=1 Tax=Papaver atlanticum TaxID=357466 RepID=A0AAD4RY73_9MAGN|nr:hypothetical protein MKW98_015378 [Papaver atlanticum]
MSSDKCAEVRFISTDIVRPANYCSSSGAASDECIELSKWDLTMLTVGYTQRGLLYSCKEEDKTTMVTRLKTSLALTLDHFFPLAGRVAVRKHSHGVDATEIETSSVYIDCNSKGAEFIHAIADNITVGNIIDPVYVPRVLESLVSLNNVMNYEGLSKPLLSIQVTELIDGVFIGCSMNHSVCDGTSFWHFFNSWSEISRETTTTTTTHHGISRIPFLKRWFPESAGTPIQLLFSIDSKSFKETYTSTTTATSASQLELKFFHFTAENIAGLKAKANLCISAESTSAKISSLQALLAHFWVAITRARYLNQDDETSYLLAINYRGRLNPPVPQEYFGNLSGAGLVTVKVGELLERGIGWGSLLLNQVIMSHNDKAIRSSCDSWIDKPILLVPFNSASSSRSGHSLLLTGSSPRFNMYGNDFGWGRPIAVRSAGSSCKMDGVLSAHPGPNEGSIEIEACLSVETFEALENNAEFMEFVTV